MDFRFEEVKERSRLDRVAHSYSVLFRSRMQQFFATRLSLTGGQIAVQPFLVALMTRCQYDFMSDPTAATIGYTFGVRASFFKIFLQTTALSFASLVSLESHFASFFGGHQ